MCVESAHAGLVWMTLGQQLKAEGNETVATVDLCSARTCAVMTELFPQSSRSKLTQRRKAICDRASAL